jgi:hypothetical protein
MSAITTNQRIHTTITRSMIETGILKEATPYHHIFLDGKVPLLSIFPCRPGENLPFSYTVNPGFLTSLQKELLARLLNQVNPDKTHDQCLRAVNNGVAIDIKWFAGVLRSPQGESPHNSKSEVLNIVSQIDAWLSESAALGLVALLNIAVREQTNVSYQVKEFGFDDIPRHVIELIDNLSADEYLSISYHISTGLLEYSAIQEAS